LILTTAVNGIIQNVLTVLEALNLEPIELRTKRRVERAGQAGVQFASSAWKI
jgi:hypothetical protein